MFEFPKLRNSVPIFLFNCILEKFPEKKKPISSELKISDYLLSVNQDKKKKESKSIRRSIIFLKRCSSYFTLRSTKVVRNDEVCCTKKFV
jgi:hypothetical protein